MIRWDSVEVVFGSSRVLGPVSLDVEGGEWVGLIGPNGAGKSTMLRAALGLVGHEGTISFTNGQRRSGLDAAWMPQRPRLPDDMGVTDYVMLGRTPHIGYLGGESQHDIETVDRALERLDLGKLARRPMSTLSGGESQRAVLARALAQESHVLLLDEPTASLDLGHAIEVLEVVDQLRRSEGLTVVTAVHDLTLAGRFADRLVLLADGVVQADGTAAEVITEANLEAHYGAGVRVVHDEDGPAVIPTRRPNG
ncbi:MAG: ABC transporter ATP-binding protein [Actinomycetota bacterium]|nr:ABC transporter ATP-binding protein [Actinomycetota bacterium]